MQELINRVINHVKYNKQQKICKLKKHKSQKYSFESIIW